MEAGGWNILRTPSPSAGASDRLKGACLFEICT